MQNRNPAASAEAAELVRVDDPDIRILRRVQPLHNWPVLAEPEEPFIRVAALDFETTGFDPDCDVIIDCAVALLLVDQTGRIVEIEDVYEGLQDPGFELPPRSEERRVGEEWRAGRRRLHEDEMA